MSPSTQHNELLAVDKEPRRYEFAIIQQPEIARTSAPSEKERRIVDPPCILQLKIYDNKGVLDDNAMRSPFWVVQCLLHGDYENPSHYLQGQLTASAAYVTPGWAHEAGCYFAFNDLALSTPGVYQLRFLLTTVRPLPIAPNELPVVAEARSQSVTAYTQRSFPGVAASTDLAKSLAEQIMTISIRNVQQRS